MDFCICGSVRQQRSVSQQRSLSQQNTHRITVDFCSSVRQQRSLSQQKSERIMVDFCICGSVRCVGERVGTWRGRGGGGFFLGGGARKTTCHNSSSYFSPPESGAEGPRRGERTAGRTGCRRRRKRMTARSTISAWRWTREALPCRSGVGCAACRLQHGQTTTTTQHTGLRHP